MLGSFLCRWSPCFCRRHHGDAKKIARLHFECVSQTHHEAEGEVRPRALYVLNGPPIDPRLFRELFLRPVALKAKAVDVRAHIPLKHLDSRLPHASESAELRFFIIPSKMCL